MNKRYDKKSIIFFTMKELYAIDFKYIVDDKKKYHWYIIPTTVGFMTLAV